jgi:hypothetical protein
MLGFDTQPPFDFTIPGPHTELPATAWPFDATFGMFSLYVLLMTILTLLYRFCSLCLALRSAYGTQL